MSRALLGEVLSCLTKAERKVVTEKWLLDHDHGEIGASLGVSRSTARVLLSRARARMQAFVKAKDLIGNLGLGWAGSRVRRWLHELTGPALAQAMASVGAVSLIVMAAMAITPVPKVSAARTAAPAALSAELVAGITVDSGLERAARRDLAAAALAKAADAATPAATGAPPAAAQHEAVVNG